MQEVKLKRAAITGIEEYPDKHFIEIVENWGITGAKKNIYSIVFPAKRQVHLQWIKTFIGVIFSGVLQKFGEREDWDLMAAQKITDIIKHN